MYKSEIRQEFVQTLTLHEINKTTLEKLWENRTAISFEDIRGLPVYIIGVESKTEDGEHFVRLDTDGLPLEIIGGVYELQQILRDNHVSLIYLYEV